MLKVGDIVRYHGRKHQAKPRQRYVGTQWVIMPYEPILEHSTCVLRLDPVGHNAPRMNVYLGDVELVTVEPEEYEGWFVA